MSKSSFLKRLSALILSALIIFGSIPLSTLGVLDFDGLFSVKAEAADEIETDEEIDEMIVTASTQNPDYSDLTVYQYLAKLCTNYNYSGALNEYGTRTDYPPYALMNDYYMDPDKASKARIIFNEFNSATDYKTTHDLYKLLTFDLGDLSKEAFKLDDYYSAIILSVIDTEMYDDNFIDDLNCKTNKDIIKFTKNISKIIKETSDAEITDLDFDNILICDLEEGDFEALIELIYADESTMQLQEFIGKDIDAIKDVMSFGKTVSDAIKNIAVYSNLATVGASIQEVLHQIYLNCPEDNIPLKSAAKNVYEAACGKISYEMLSLKTAGYAAYEYLVQEVVGKLWKSVLSSICGELTAGVLIGQAIGKMISNYAFATDAIDEQLCVISALVDFEDVIVAAVSSLESIYKSDDNPQNAECYMKGLQVLMSTYDLGLEYCEDFVEKVYEKGVINNIVYSDSEELANWRKIFVDQKEINARRDKFLRIETYKEVYKIDAPAAYEACFGDDASEYVPITGMTVTQKKEIAIGDEGPSYDYFIIEYSPSNRTEVILSEYVTSSDESVIKADNGMYLGGGIKAVGEGTCTLTFSTPGYKFSASVTVTVSGTSSGVGESEDTSSEYLTFALYSGKQSYYVSDCDTSASGKIVIPEKYNNLPVTRIGGDAFRSCTSLTALTIPDSVTSIGENAFRSCTSLESVTIGNGVMNIGDYAFRDCKKLNAVYISDLTAWCNILFDSGESNPLDHAKNLYINGKLAENITIPDSVTEIGFAAFSGCTSLTSVTIGNSVTSIGSCAFDYCTNLTSVTIPDSVTDIGYAAFYGCTSLESVIIPDSVKSIGESAFRDCRSLKSVTLPNSVTSIGSCAFGYCTNLTSVTIPDSVTEIGYAAFYGCTSLTSVTIGNSVTSIGSCAFGYCTNLTSVTIPDSVTSIGDYTFYNCTSLTSVTIPDSVTMIDWGAFFECTSLEKINVDLLNEYYTSEDGVLFNKSKTELIQYPTGKKSKMYSIPDSVTSIGDYTFYNCTRLTSITIPDSVKSIGSSVFYGCTSLESVIIPDSVKSIGESAFRDCRSLKSVTLPNSVTSIGESAFRDCRSLESVTLPNSVKSIGTDVFRGCASLTSVTIPNSVTSISEDAFYNCSNLNHVLFTGSSEEWNNISIESYNSCLLNATKHFNATGTEITCVEGTPTTCITDGYEAGWFCSICNDYFAGHEVIKAHHIDENDDSICDICSNPSELTIKAGETKTIEVQKGETVYIAFRPTVSGTYTFTSSSGSDTYGYLYNADMTQITSNDDGGNNNNFKITYRLEAGSKYYFGARFYSSTTTGSFPVTLTLTTPDAPTLTPASSSVTIDTEKKLIMGVAPKTASVSDVLSVSESGYTVSASEGYYLGTGSTVTFSVGDFSYEYTVVVSSDLNGDGVVDVLDVAISERISSGNFAFDDTNDVTGAFRLAADANGDGETDVNDYSAIVNTALSA